MSNSFNIHQLQSHKFVRRSYNTKYICTYTTSQRIMILILELNSFNQSKHNSIILNQTKIVGKP